MPTYEFSCTNCGNSFERFDAKMTTTPPLAECGECGKIAVERLIGSGGSVSVDNFQPQTLHQLPGAPRANNLKQCLDLCKKHGFERNQGMSSDHTAAAQAGRDKEKKQRRTNAAKERFENSRKMTINSGA